MRILKDRISTNDIFLHIMEFPSCNRKEKNLYEIRIQRSMSIKLKRVYEPPAMDDGYRVLVERLWPRGVSKERAHVDLWMKDAGASRAAPVWFGHDPDKWEDFRTRYFEEIRGRPEVIRELDKLIAREKTVTFLFAAHDELHNNAVALKEFLDAHLQ